MKTIIAALFLLIVTTTAEAQSMPATGQLYFVGSTTELLLIRASISHQFHFQSLAHGWSGLLPINWEAPHDDGSDERVIGPPFGLGEVDCMTAYVNDHNWNGGSYLYLGGCEDVDGQTICVPQYSELQGPETVPAVCQQYLINLYCGEFAELMCEFGATYCCPQ